MNEYQLYFSRRNIIRTLSKYRIKAAKEGHKKHLVADISSSDKVIENFKNRLEEDRIKNIIDLLPPRRKWYKPNITERNRIKDSQKLQLLALTKTIKTTHIRVVNNEMSPPDWYTRLQDFIEKTQARVFIHEKAEIITPEIFPIKKAKKNGRTECRPISQYSLKDRIIISLTAKYFTDIFDDVFCDSSYAFRSVKEKASRTHHTAVQRILDYFITHKGKDIYASECDLEKFFDCVSHEIVLNKLDFLSKQHNINIDAKARNIFIEYLKSYSFNRDVYSKNGTDFFDSFNIKNGFFKWVADELIKTHYPLSTDRKNLSDVNIGVPQGGAISCFLSNLLLHEVDLDVIDNSDPDLLYLRFCDDMIILHTNQGKCKLALERYLTSIKKIKLIVHEPEEIKEYSKNFWKEKSKKPYKIGSKAISKSNVPWLSFVGYQIKHDGSIRVRKKSIEKEKEKQLEECKRVLKALEQTNKKRTIDVNLISKKSHRQQLFALENRLISMSVGRVRLGQAHTTTMCWTNGFKLLTTNRAAIAQLRMLDKHRTMCLYNTKLALADLIKSSENPDRDTPNIGLYFGHPFSYCGFLKNKSNPKISPPLHHNV